MRERFYIEGTDSGDAPDGDHLSCCLARAKAAADKPQPSAASSIDAIHVLLWGLLLHSLRLAIQQAGAWQAGEATDVPGNSGKCSVANANHMPSFESSCRAPLPLRPIASELALVVPEPLHLIAARQPP